MVAAVWVVEAPAAVVLAGDRGGGTLHLTFSPLYFSQSLCCDCGCVFVKFSVVVSVL